MPLSVRAAEAPDLPAVIGLIRGMFIELGTSKFPTSWAHDAGEDLQRRMGRDVGISVATDGASIIAVAVGLVDQRLPSPRRPSGRIGYVEWLATDPTRRRMGAARGAMEHLLSWFGTQGVDVIDVHASAAAAHLYEELGFTRPTAAALRRRT